MIICVGSHLDDKAAEEAAYKAGFGTSGLGGSEGPPEPGVYYFPKIEGQVTGWARVWSREDESQPFRWIGLDPKSLIEVAFGKIINEQFLSQLTSALFPHISSELRVLDIRFNPNYGPQIGNRAGCKLHSQYEGQMVRQWVGNDIVYLWVARNVGEDTQWIRIRN